MRHRKDLQKLGRPRAHRKAVVNSLVRSLLTHDRITTTLSKAKAAQRVAERLVSRCKRDDLATRRYAYTYLNNHALVRHLFDEVRPRYEDRSSGFTRIFLLGNRLGDGAQMAVLEMTVKGEESKKTSRDKKTHAKPAAKEQATAKTSKKEDSQPKKTATKKKKPATKK
ncbi:50S ribosomal protein L17 [candidate division WOR-3 bacterium]|nr:50S ribosomal protein L17 [candidate division WOR-3 bacterium]